LPAGAGRCGEARKTAEQGVKYPHSIQGTRMNAPRNAQYAALSSCSCCMRVTHQHDASSLAGMPAPYNMHNASMQCVLLVLHHWAEQRSLSVLQLLCNRTAACLHAHTSCCCLPACKNTSYAKHM
jgi:hypothetical protein